MASSEEKVYAEAFNTASKHPKVKLYNFSYSLKRKNKEDSLYRCDRDKCNASITILDCDRQVIKVNGLKVSKITLEDITSGHKHSSSEIDVLAKEFEYNLITRSSSESLPLPRIFQQEESKSYKKASLKGFNDEEIAKTFKTFESKRSVMYKHKNEKYPPNPKTL